MFDLYDGKPLVLSNFYSQNRLLIPIFIASILSVLMIAAGIVLLIIPGIYLSLKFTFFSYFIVDKNAGIMDSFKKSSSLTEGVKLRILLFQFIVGLVNIIGFLLLGVGLFVTIPTTMMALIHVYRKLLSQTPGI